MKDENMQAFDEQFHVASGKKGTLIASNIINAKRMDIETPEISIRVRPENVDLIETHTLEGRKMLTIPMEDVRINGISVKD